MLDHSRGDPWSGATYHGFADAAAPVRPPLSPPRRRRGGGKASLLSVGFVVALAFGLVLGLVARPELAAPPVLTAAAPPASTAIPLSVAPAAATEAPQAEAAPPEQMAELLPEPPLPPRPLAPSTRPSPARLAQPAKSSAKPSGPGRTAAAAPEPGYLRLPPGMTEAQARADPNCSDAPPGAEQMVCSDPQLAEADAEMARAYFRALEAGIPAADLRQEQRDWLAIREDAARYSRRAVASVYDQRLRELDGMAAAAESPGDAAYEDDDQ